jgi:phenylpyruvate tautomerase PptA (4-oxalocrotonate tautomerase family)
MPTVEVSTRETLSDEVRAKLAEQVSKTIVTMSGGMAICEF